MSRVSRDGRLPQVRRGDPSSHASDLLKTFPCELESMCICTLNDETRDDGGDAKESFQGLFCAKVCSLCRIPALPGLSHGKCNHAYPHASFVNDGGLVSRGRLPMRLLDDSSKETGSDLDLNRVHLYPERVTFYSKAGEPFMQ